MKPLEPLPGMMGDLRAAGRVTNLPIFVRLFTAAALWLIGMYVLTLDPETVHAAGEPAGQVTILHDTHIHGRYYMPNLPDENIANLFGVAGMIKKSKPDALYLANGDDIGSAVISDVFYGKHVIDAFNAYNGPRTVVDADTFGNHDFDYGTEVLRQRVKESKFPWISANIIDTRTNDTFAKETGNVIRYTIKTINGVRVGITGLGRTSAFMDNTVAVLNPVTVMNKLIPEMKGKQPDGSPGADIIVVISHLSRTQSESLAKAVNGIAVIVGDHSENVLERPEEINGTILSFRGCEFQYLGELTLQVSGGRVTTYTYVRHKITDEVAKTGFTPDPEVKKVMDQYMSVLNSTVIGSSSVQLDTRSSVIRKTETAFGDYVADAMRAWKNADAALFNAGIIATNTLYEPGAITQKRVLDLLPQTLQAVELQVTGQQLLDALENGVGKVESSATRFPQVSGINFSYDSTKPAGKRIVKATINGSPINPSSTYTLVTTDYIFSGGEGYSAALGNAESLMDPATGPLVTTLVRNKIQADGTISPETEGRIIANDFAAPVTIATVAPASPDGNDGWYKQNVQFTLKAVDSLSGVAKTEYRTNGGTWTLYTGQVTISTDGQYTVDYRSRDVAGNLESQKTMTFNIDQTAPKAWSALSPEPSPAPYTSDVTVNLIAADVTSGVADTIYRLNGGAWKSYTDPIVFKDNGNYTIEYRGKDAAGNTGAVQSVSFSIVKPVADVTAPVSTAVVDPALGGLPSTTDVTVTLTAVDEASGVTNTAYRLNGGEWVAYTGPITLTDNGSYTVEYRSTDAAGNVETAQSVSFSIAKPVPDVTAPVTTAVVDPALGGSPSTTDVTVTLTAVDEASVVTDTVYRLNGGEWVAYTGPITLTNNGSYTVEYRSTDGAGNVEAAQSISFSIAKPVPDVTAPVTTATVDPALGGSPSTTDLTVTLTAVDEASGVTNTVYRLNSGEWVVYTGPITLTNNGSYTVEYRSTDGAGNVEAAQSISFSIAKPVPDVTSPVTTSTVDPALGGSPSTTDVTVTLTAVDEASGVTDTVYRLNGGEWITYVGPITLTDNGSYTVEYRSTDAAGNVEAVQSVSFSIGKPVPDTTAPVTAAVVDPALGGSPSTTDVTVTLTAVDEASGVTDTVYRLNGGEWVVYTGPITLTDNGSYTVEYRSTDAAGNVEAAQSVSFSIAKPVPDTTAPVTAAVVDPALGGSPSTTDVTLTLSSSDEASGVANTVYRLNGGEWVVYAGSITFTVNGSYTVEYCSTDAAGNVEAVQSVSFSIAKPVPDVTAPVTTAVVDPALGGSPATTDVTVTLTAVDEASGVTDTVYRLNGGEWVDYTGPITFTVNGSYTVEYRSTDGAGNVEAAQSVSFSIAKPVPDVTAPVTTAVVDPALGGSPATTDVTVTLTAVDEASGVTDTVYRLNGGEWITYVGPITLTDNGSYTVEYRSTDGAGNVEAVQSVSFSIAKPIPDVTAPVTTAVVDPALGGSPATTDVTVTLTAVDEASGVTDTVYRLNGGEWITYAGPITFTVNGSYTVEYRSTDGAGNVEAAQSVSFSIAKPVPDVTAPVTTAVVDPALGGSPSTTDVTVTLTASDEASGVTNTVYRLNGGEWVDYTGPITLTNNGSYTVEYRSTDVAGNVEAVQSISFSIAKPVPDVTAPVTSYNISNSYPVGLKGWYLNKVGVSFSATDNMTGVAKTEYRVNGGSWKVYSSNFNTSSSDGIYLYEYRSTDKANNVEPIQSFEVKIDKTAPTTTYKLNKLANGTNGWHTIKVYFYLTPKDNLSGVTQLEYRINGGAWTSYTVAVPLLTDGHFTIEYRSMDVAGNLQLSAPIYVNIDKAAPITTASVTSASTGGKNVDLTATDATSGISKTEYCVNGGAWTVYSGRLNFTAVGSTLVEYRSTDMAGNVEAIKKVTITN